MCPLQAGESVLMVAHMEVECVLYAGQNQQVKALDDFQCEGGWMIVIHAFHS